MNRQAYDSTESGYLTDNFEGIGRTFTEVEVLWQTTHHLLARAKRYGRWWMLKAQQAEADYMGLIFMAMAGYNPNVAVTFWQR